MQRVCARSRIGSLTRFVRGVHRGLRGLGIELFALKSVTGVGRSSGVHRGRERESDNETAREHVSLGKNRIKVMTSGTMTHHELDFKFW